MELLIHKRERGGRREGSVWGNWDVTWGRFEGKEKRESKRIGHVYRERGRNAGFDVCKTTNGFPTESPNPH